MASVKHKQLYYLIVEGGEVVGPFGTKAAAKTDAAHHSAEEYEIAKVVSRSVDTPVTIKWKAVR